ncbi:MAG: family protein phosphatase [Thermomicrobiales bacterium]|nr:family protein phosphatase [Thermomicrobiales bacterium]
MVGSATHVGGRPENEDAVHVSELPPLGSGPDASEGGFLLAVADGMGGYQRGEVASGLAIETVRAMFVEDPGADIALLLKQAFRRANEKIYENGLASGPSAMMGTTLVVAATRGKYATIASIGDSRAYLARANRLTQVTKDHSLVAEQVSRGSMTEAEARESPHRNILTHALGHKPKLDTKMPSVFEITLLPEDHLLILTDGFFDVVPDDDLLRIVLDNPADVAAQRLVELAVERGTSDNVSAVVASVQPVRVAEPVLVSAGGRPSFLLPAAAILLLIAVLAVMLFLFVI